ncbi:unnamed protein product [Arctia plantaginis]|uniref:C2H2-type domain-containing protein n=1 Tax=Arctia plantaginis TaxID=874455 RepID=A0A8S1BNP5_ARCPL|nr:unnamed protein product [Arctia plantaginis]
MNDCITFNICYKEVKSEIPKNYCFRCLCDNNERQIQKHTFICGPLKELFQMQSISLCYICKRIAQHTELFIQNVQSNQILMEKKSNATMGEKLTTAKLQTQPVVSLKKVLCNVIELIENDSNSCEESSFVVINTEEKVDVKVKIEMKEETELRENIEVEFVSQGNEFPKMCMKEEDNTPLNTPFKEELSPENDELDLNVNSTIKKKVKKKNKTKKEGEAKSRKEIPEVKMVYITRKQCMEERTRMSEDQKYIAYMYKCTDCIKGFTFKGSYDTHMEKHNRSNGDFECDICKQRMDSDDKLVRHMRYHLIRYICSACGLTRNCRISIKDHYSAYHLGGDHQYNCSQCVKTFNRQASLRKHVLCVHARGERVQCAYCAGSYADKDVLRSHMMLKHSKEVSAVEVRKRCVCAECGKAFKTPSQLRKHSIKHSDVRKYYCVECDKSFKSECILKAHLKTAAIHVKHEELPLSCLHCEQRFSDRRNLQRHMNRVHLNVKPYKCDRCDKAYMNSWGLKNHQRYTHEGHKRPLQFSCPMCDRLFDRKEILKSHIRTHTGERPYQCSKCPAQFSQSNVLRTHDRLIHLKLTRDDLDMVLIMMYWRVMVALTKEREFKKRDSR